VGAIYTGKKDIDIGYQTHLNHDAASQDAAVRAHHALGA